MRTLTAMFDSRSDAEAARERLATLGISQHNVTILDNDSIGSHGHDAQESRGMWDSIKSLFSTDSDSYAEGLRRGGYLLTAQVEDGQVDHAIDILDDDGTVDLDQRSESWRQEGWTGGSAAMGAAGAMDRGLDAGTRGQSGDETRIPIVEEQLRVGKREVARGGVRVRSYIVEEPVHEDVTLREERVHVERRPVSGEVRAGNLDDLMRERTIEMTETAEEAVVDKRAHIREEVVINKTVNERVERIDGTVGHTEVEVEQIAGDGARRDSHDTQTGIGQPGLHRDR